MTYSEKKTIESEKKKNNSCPKQSFNTPVNDFSLQYIFFDQALRYSHKSPFSGYLHIFSFKCEQTSHQSYSIGSSTFQVHPGEHNIHPVQQKEVLEWEHKEDSPIGLALFLPKETIHKLLPPLSDSPKTVNNIDNHTDHILLQVAELYKKKAAISKLRIPSFLIELLLHQFESLLLQQGEKENSITKNNFEKIKLAQQFIESDLSKNYSIAELSKLVGTNEQYLKKYFKQYFGKTIMTYSTSLKLQHAKALIINSDCRIADIARVIGYKHATHFSTAFKKHFGYIPNSLRNP